MSAKETPKTKAGKDVIYVDVDDEITSIIDKVENAEQKVVALVLPKRAASLQSIVNMKLLARSAKTAGKNPVLITSEAALLPLAGAAGLHVAKNLQSKPEVPEAPSGISAAAANVPVAEEVPETDEALNEEDLPKKIDYGSTVGALAAAHEAENTETIDLDDEDEAAAAAAPKAAKVPKDKKNRVPNFDRFRMMLGLGALGVIALIVFLILAVTVLPKATITLKTSSEPVSANFNLQASTATPALDSKTGALPAKLESTDQTGSQQVTATGQQNNGDKASGTVTFYNCNKDDTLSGTNHTVPAGTGVSANGLNFITTESATVAPSHFTGNTCKNDVPSNSVNVKAQAAGAKYNLDATNYSVAGFSTITGSGSKMTGGTDNIVTVLTQSDVDGAKQKLTSGTAGDQFAKDFTKKLESQGEYVLSATLKAGDASITANPAVGQPASTSNVSIKITYTVLTVKKSDLSQAIQDKLAGQIDKSKQKLNGNFLNDADITVQSQSGNNAATLSVNENTTAVPIINIASVKKQAEGKKAGDIKAAIGAWPGVKEVDVKLSPFWVSKAPGKDSKIKVVLQEVKASSGSSGQP
jgi:hypothetical protein